MPQQLVCYSHYAPQHLVCFSHYAPQHLVCYSHYMPQHLVCMQHPSTRRPFSPHSMYHTCCVSRVLRITRCVSCAVITCYVSHTVCHVLCVTCCVSRLL